MLDHAVLADLPFGINPGLLLAQIVNFIVLFWLLNRFAFPALRRTLDDRAATIRQGVENAERARNELAKAQQSADEIILDARRQGQQIITEATIAGQRVRAQIEAEARTSAEGIIQQAELRIRQEEAQARNALRQQVADLAIDAASRVVGESLDGPRQRRLVEEFVAQAPEVS
jgi:F-type H+-transporting ATPase subunit b